MAKIGIIAMSAKPYHIGHDMMIRRASEENDEVHVYVSLSDRKRSGDDVPILGSDMQKLWKGTIEQSLPSNVVITYGGSPVGNVWKELGKANEEGSNDVYTLYADADDLSQNYPENLLLKYCGNLYKDGKIKLAATQRASSGTQMRSYLASGDKESFMKNLPPGVDKDMIWNVLRDTAVNPPNVKTTAGPKRKVKVEALLRSYVKRLVLEHLTKRVRSV